MPTLQIPSAASQWQAWGTFHHKATFLQPSLSLPSLSTYTRWASAEPLSYPSASATFSRREITLWRDSLVVDFKWKNRAAGNGRVKSLRALRCLTTQDGYIVTPTPTILPPSNPVTVLFPSLDLSFVILHNGMVLIQKFTVAF